MHIYFYDENMRYIGRRLLNEGEEIPQNATLEVAEVKEGQEAYLIDSKWVVNDISQEPIISDI